MSTPEGKKNLWKNIDWKDDKEKEAFFNKYFNSKDRKLVSKEINDAINQYKDSLIDFMETDIVEGRNKRKPSTYDIKEFVKGR